MGSIMIIPITGIIISLIVLIPGFGISQAVLIGYSKPETIPYIIASGLILNSFKECSLPSISSNIGAMSIESSISINEHKYFNTLISWKVLCWFIGIGLSYFMPITMLPKEVSIIICFIILASLRLKELPSAIFWLILVSLIFIWTKDSNNQIVIVNILLFNISNIFTPTNKVKHKTINYVPVNTFLLVISSWISLVSPGISPSLITSRLGKSFLSTLLTATCIETVIESCGLGLITRHLSNGKSIIGSEVAVADFNLLMGCTGVILLTAFIAKLISKPIINSLVNHEEFYKYLSLIISILTIIKIESYYLLLILLIFIAQIILNKLPKTRHIKGLTFISPMLFI
jgi:hypothetical protein